jgi:hypothetical protein
MLISFLAGGLPTNGMPFAPPMAFAVVNGVLVIRFQQVNFPITAAHNYSAQFRYRANSTQAWYCLNSTSRGIEKGGLGDRMSVVLTSG